MIYKSILVLIIICLSNIGYSQNSKSTEIVIQDGDTIVLSAIAISNITSNVEIVIKEIRTIREENKESDKIKTADSVYLDALELLDKEKKVVAEFQNNTSQRALDDAIQQWTGYKKILAEWHSILSERSERLTKSITRTENLITTWKLTLNDAKKGEAPPGILLNIRESINKLNSLKNDLKTELLDIYSKQSKLTEITISVDETLKFINELKKSLISSYLSRDSDPIWAAQDSTFYDYFQKQFYVDAFNESTKSIGLFYNSNKDKFAIHLIVVLLIILLFYYLSNQNIEDKNNTNLIETSKKAIKQYVSSGLIIGVLVTVWIYPTRQLIIDDLFQLILLILIAIYIPKLSGKKYNSIIYLSMILHLTNQIQLLFPTDLLIVRILIFIEALIAIFIVFYSLKKDGDFTKAILNSKYSFLLNILKIFYVLIFIVIIANIFGYLGLSILFNNLIVNSLFNAFIALVSLFVVTRALLLLFKSKYVLMLHTFRKYGDKIYKNVKTILTLFTIFIWARSFLLLLGVYKDVFNWLSGIFETSWQFSKVTIDLGSVLSFLMVILVTTLIVRVIKVILEEEIFFRIKMPRGVPGAISMVIRYFIVGWGIVIAISALGIDLSQFGLLAGALGVGIGFGLQNIVFNFIAGLILAFERPIQVGDTVETGTIMGTVKSIGVRSSTILTFDGAEVIVPNGNLISSDVINWTLTDRRKRRDIFVGVEYGSDPHKVMEILKNAAQANINVLQTPEPWILFDGFGDSALNFRIRIWTSMDIGLTTQSEVTIAIYDGLTEAGITIPFPQRDLHLKSIDPNISNLSSKVDNFNQDKKEEA